MKRYAVLLTLLSMTHPAAARAGDIPEFELVLSNHVYQPAELHVPANTRFRVVVRNDDTTPEEFESTDFNRETLVLPHHRVVIYIGPLHAGSYSFFGDFNRETAQGRLLVQ